ncbi:shikimate dehydrogenase [Nocardioides silvaticus]|uniref:Shikimate dehydrogenase n=1 Tax=Nocardioides silvaticus TaxID=2201891 RepID=A0A316TKI5_9ACTN|nr:shikimate dehydrogenase [Nocardioides silvaticus]PWN02802.1 shikimate dehydrogenase [Nocardioides silvaticus]
MRCAVLGDPVAHSLSPALHRAGYAAVGLDWEYDAVQVPAGGLVGVVSGLDAEWRGLSVTAPLKREAMILADVVSDRVRLAGAANTLLLTGEEVHADNTDLPGAVAAIRERFTGAVGDVLILGAGATAASTGLALADLGATRIAVAARTASRASDTVAAIAGHPSRPRVKVLDLATVELSDAENVVVSTVPVVAQTPGLVSRVGHAEVVFDVVYDPWPTPLARAATGTLVSGLDLLVHQAALQFTAFTGVAAPLEQMRAAGEAALRERAR